ncbi:MAG: hypothetical protein ACWA6U_13315 [Breznakibacter sp.]
MKKLNLCGVITLLVLMVFGLQVKAESGVNLNGFTNTSLGSYVITELTSEEVKGELMRKFELKYENAKDVVVIYLSTNARCREYSVLSNGLDIQYVCTKKAFGARPLIGKLLRHKPEVDAVFVNDDELARQEKLSNGELSVEEALGYIACFYPALVKHQNLI